jgi:hypothetical protein
VAIEHGVTSPCYANAVLMQYSNLILTTSVKTIRSRSLVLVLLSSLGVEAPTPSIDNIRYTGEDHKEKIAVVICQHNRVHTSSQVD